MISHFMSRQFMTFLLTGGVAAAVNFCSRIVYNLWVSFSAAVIIAYITGMITAFVLAKMFVFKESSQSLNRSIFFFTLINLVAVLQTWLISMAMVYYVLPAMGVNFFNKELAHALGIVVPVFTSYLGHKHFSFKSS